MKSCWCVTVVTLLIVMQCLEVIGEDDLVSCKRVWDEGEESYDMVCNGITYREDAGRDKVGSSSFFVDAFCSMLFTLVAGIASGLTLGLLSLDVTNLQIIINGGEAKEAGHARKILPVIKKHHQLLVTLLLTNAIAMEALPIFLDKMVPTVVAIIVSVTLILMFGEIIPQAMCSRYGLSIGAKLYWLVRGLMLIMFPIAWPLGKVLDYILGEEHGNFFRRSELGELVKLHELEGYLTTDEITIMNGVLELSKKSIADVLTPLQKVFMLDAEEPLTRQTIRRIMASGRSRIPVYRGSRDTILGMLLVKDLLRMIGSDGEMTPLTRSTEFFPPSLRTSSTSSSSVSSTSSTSSTNGTTTLNGTDSSSTATSATPSPPPSSFKRELSVSSFPPPSLNQPVGSLFLHPLPYMPSNVSLFESLSQFRCGKSHMAIIIDTMNEAKVLGILTMEDIIEELIQSEIFDESDLQRFIDETTVNITSSGDEKEKDKDKDKEKGNEVEMGVMTNGKVVRNDSVGDFGKNISQSLASKVHIDIEDDDHHDDGHDVPLLKVKK